MVEECQVDGALDSGGYLFGVFVCRDGMWIAWMVEVCWLSLNKRTGMI